MKSNCISNDADDVTSIGDETFAHNCQARSVTTSNANNVAQND